MPLPIPPFIWRGITRETLSEAIEQAGSTAILKALDDGVDIEDAVTIKQCAQRAEHDLVAAFDAAENEWSRSFEPLDVAKAELDRDPVGTAAALKEWQRKQAR